MKRIVFIITFAVVLIFSVTFASSNPKVQVNGKILDFTDENGNVVEAQIINSRTMVPLRKIFEELECTVDWDQATKTVTATRGDRKIQLTIGEEKAYNTYIYDTKEIILDSPPVIVDNRTLVPLRFIGESLGNSVGWDSQNRTAIIIDYEVLAKLVDAKSPITYLVFPLTTDVEVEKYYYDDSDPAYNSYSKIYIEELWGLNNDYGYSAKVEIDGNSEFVSEVKEEGWNDFYIEVFGNDDDDNFENAVLQSNNYVFSKMFGKNKNEKININFEEYGLSKENVNDLAGYIKNLFNLDSSKIDVNTYSIVEKDFKNFIKNFLSGSKKLTENDFKYSLLDLNNIFNARLTLATDILQLFNKKAFKYELNYQDLFVDYPDISYEFKEESNQITITATLKNEYKERIKYKLVFHVMNLT